MEDLSICLISIMYYEECICKELGKFLQLLEFAPFVEGSTHSLCFPLEFLWWYKWDEVLLRICPVQQFSQMGKDTLVGKFTLTLFVVVKS